MLAVGADVVVVTGRGESDVGRTGGDYVADGIS